MNIDKNTSAFEVDQDTMCHDYGHANDHQSKLNIPLSHPNLARTELLKGITTNQIALSLLTAKNDRLVNESNKLMSCAENVQLMKNGKVRTYNRCKRRLCALCSTIESQKWNKDVKEAPDHFSYTMLDDDPIDGLDSVMALKLTLNAGQSCPVTELKPVIRNVLHKLWPRMLKTKSVSTHLVGALRATEVTVTGLNEDGIPLANPHIHGVLLLKAPKDKSEANLILDEISLSISHYWRRVVRRELKKLDLETRIVSGHAQLIEPLTRQTSNDFSEWASYCTKGAVSGLAKSLQSEDFDESAFTPLSMIWTEVERSIKGIRMIATSGEIKNALDEARNTRIIRAHQPPKPDEQPTITHKYSFTKSKYIPHDEWVAEIDKPSNHRVLNMMRIISKASDGSQPTGALKIKGPPDFIEQLRLRFEPDNYKKDVLFLNTQESVNP